GGALLGLAGLAPGAYVVSYDGAFAFEPLTPAAVAGRLAVGAYRQLEQGQVSVRLANTGGEDGPPARLELWASQGGMGETLVASQTIELLAGAPLTVTLPWAPPLAGDWILIPRLRAPAELAVDLPPALANVAAQPAPPAGTILQTTVNRAFALRLAGIALGFVALAGAISWLGWRISPRRSL
ncbi:MAG TPA: hypothetical protein VGE07_18130, partial [Herpetosiphonaceae bacterium]